MKNWFSLILVALLCFAGCADNKKNTNNAETGTQTPNSSLMVMPDNPGNGEPGIPDKPGQRNLKLANIQRVELNGEDDKGRLFILMHGTFPNPCSHFAEIKQERNGNTISIKVLTFIPPGPGCPAGVVPLHHGAHVDTKNLEPGQYDIDVNGVKVAYTKK